MVGHIGCRCRRVSDGNGKKVGATWLAMHDQGVRLVLVDGSVLEGWATDVREWPPTSVSDGGVLLELWPAAGELEYVDASEVQSVTPLQDQTSVVNLVQKVIDVVAFAPSMDDGYEEEFSLVVDEHSKLEVLVRKRTLGCLPHQRAVTHLGSSG